MSVAGVERCGLRCECTVKRMQHRRLDPVCHGQTGESRVVVNDIEASTAVGCVDQIKRLPDMVDLIDRPLDLVRMSLVEQIHDGRA